MTKNGDSIESIITDSSRLPTKVVPIHYSITIKPEIENFTFSANESIQVNVREATNWIVLNSLDIEIKEAVFVSNNQEQIATKIDINKKNEIAIITFENELPLGNGNLNLCFTGEINDLMKGFYRSKYKNENGEIRYGCTTQFESTYARRAFPCWDEPAHKATFEITLIAPKDRVVLSNMPIEKETDYEHDKNKRVVKFQKSPIMSTYLVAYIIGEYEFIHSKSKNGTDIKVYTLPNKTDQVKFSLDVAVKSLDFYEEYFKIPYPLPKLDLIAIPDFEAGAMENYGLLTYRETCLLYDPSNTSISVKRYVAVVIAHEIAHQWFGNLVTMEWWTHLWLNEGFARFMQYLTADAILPEFKIWERFITDSYQIALELDAYESSHPIEASI